MYTQEKNRAAPQKTIMLLVSPDNSRLPRLKFVDIVPIVVCPFCILDHPRGLLVGVLQLLLHLCSLHRVVLIREYLKALVEALDRCRHIAGGVAAHPLQVDGAELVVALPVLVRERRRSDHLEGRIQVLDGHIERVFPRLPVKLLLHVCTPQRQLALPPLVRVLLPWYHGQRPLIASNCRSNVTIRPRLPGHQAIATGHLAAPREVAVVFVTALRVINVKPLHPNSLEPWHMPISVETVVQGPDADVLERLLAERTLH
mmetsp:Transcript_44478/g.108530  ORF Transcript_44478/g.108530 Transcript_44478/m.108530 type:complete len:258 (+) Transcript_44478:1210-1983(+)